MWYPLSLDVENVYKVANPVPAADIFRGMFFGLSAKPLNTDL